MSARRKRPGIVYARGRMLWIKFVNVEDKYDWKSTGLHVGHEKEADIFLKTVIEEVVEQRRAGVLPDKPLTVARFAERWIAKRKRLGKVSATDDEARLKNHILPWIGDVLLADVIQDHVQTVMDVVMEKVGNKSMAPRTACHIYATMKAMFRKARKVLPTNPCSLDADDLPKKIDADPTWRKTAVFTAIEIEAFVTEPRIPVDRRVFWALAYLAAGERFGEAAASTWADYDPTVEPLGRLLVTKSYSTSRKSVGPVKTQVSREVPVHPVLAEVLAGWKAHGWRELMRRDPKDSDLIIPSRTGACRSANHMLKKFHQDLERIGLRKRRQHDLRRTFISLCRNNGARGDVLRFITHGPRKGDVFDGYTEWNWPELCAEVAKLKINMSGYDVLFGRARAVKNETRALTLRSDPAAPGDRNVTVAVTFAAAASQDEVQILKTPRDFSQGALRGGRDLNPRPPA